MLNGLANTQSSAPGNWLTCFHAFKRSSSSVASVKDFNYYAVPGNLTSLGAFRDRVLALWWRTLRRRSQKHRIPWTRTLALAQRWLPQPSTLHPFPDARFAAIHLR